MSTQSFAKPVLFLVKMARNHVLRPLKLMDVYKKSMFWTKDTPNKYASQIFYAKHAYFFNFQVSVDEEHGLFP